MTSEQTSQAVHNDGGINPIDAVTRLSHVIAALDRMIEFKTYRNQTIDQIARLVFMRNSLVVAFSLWQDDVHRRVNRSRNHFYIYSMTGSDSTAFVRRMRPALDFAAEELAAIAIPGTEHLVPMIRRAAEETVIYAEESRKSIVMGIDSLNADQSLNPVEFRTFSIPRSDTDSPITIRVRQGLPETR